MNAAVRPKRLLPGLVAVAVIVVCAVVIAENLLLNGFFPQQPRVDSDFSPAYLRRELTALAAAPPQVVFLGDSVLWGYELPADATAVALLDRAGCPCTNLAFKNESPPNFYALVRLFAAYGVHPKAVVVEINQKVLNAVDPSYNTLHPAIDVLARPLLDSTDLATLTAPSHMPPLEAALDAAGSRVSELYAMRADVRALVFGEVADAPSGPLTADAFEGTYDLTPLTSANVGVRFLVKTVAALHAAGVPVIAFMTPTNHRLLHDYIDSPPYNANEAYLRTLLEHNGARVIDLDATFPTSDFIDNAHLTAAGQRRLALALQPALPH